MRIVCPICKRVMDDAPADHPSRPFCSARCKLADLHAWLTEGYRVSEPAPQSSDDEDQRLN